MLKDANTMRSLPSKQVGPLQVPKVEKFKQTENLSLVPPTVTTDLYDMSLLVRF